MFFPNFGWSLLKMNAIHFHRLIIWLLVFLSVPYGFAQDTADSIGNKNEKLFDKYLNLSKDEHFQLDERKLFSEKAIELSKSMHRPKALLEALSSKGYILAQEGHYAEAFQNFSSMKQISDSVGYTSPADWRRKAYIANVMGLLYKELGVYDKSLAEYYTSLEICDSVGWKEGISVALNNISILYDLHGNTEQAITILKESWQIASAEKNNNQLFDISINLMDMYSNIGVFDSARFYGDKAMEISKIQDTPYNIAFVEVGYGKLYFAEGHYGLALKMLNRGIKTALSNGFEEIRLDALMESSKTYRHLGEYHQADSVLQLAARIDHKIRIPVLHIKWLKESALLKEATGDFQSAYFDNKRAAFLDDSINKTWETIKFAEIQSLYQIKLQKQKNIVLEKSLSLKQLQVKQQRYLIFVVLGFLIILSGLVILFHQKRKFEFRTNQILRQQNEKIRNQEKIIREKNEQRLKLELDYKNRQLTSSSLTVLKQNESLKLVIQEIHDLMLKQNIKLSTRKKLEEIIQQLRPLKTEKEWEEFRAYFEEVHPSFYSNLKKAAPDLSLIEQKVCAYLRLGLSTKEIASITFRQVRSVESTRFRIRKKLGLTASSNLYGFLEKL